MQSKPSLFVLLLLVTLIVPPLACLSTTISFAACCNAGINSTHDMDINMLIKESDPNECIAISQLDEIFREVSNINEQLPSDRMAKCLQVKRGCFYAAKASIFCENAARIIDSSNGQLTPIIHFYPDLLKSPRDCCKQHNRLPALNVVWGASMDTDINGVPTCCTIKGYKVADYSDPFTRANSVQSNDQLLSSSTQSNRTTPSSVTVVTYMPSTSSMVQQTTEFASTHDVVLNSEYSSLHSSTAAVSPTQQQYSISTDFPYSTSESSLSAQITTEAEIVCEPGFTWNPVKQLCLHTQAHCPRNMYLSVKQNRCLPKIGDQFVCPPGYKFHNDKIGCEDINECQEGVLELDRSVAACPKSGQVCINTEGSYECRCKQGFQTTRDGECVDTDECKVSSDVCKAGYECRNVIGSFQCIRQVPCGFGYVLNSETQECEDIDECKSQPDICGPNMLCVNVRGGMKCVPKKCPGKLRRNSNGECTPCPSGYTFNEQRNICDDINECKLNATLCRSFEKCTNRPGDYICEPKLRCEWGFQLNDNGTACDDINECKLKAFNCPHGQICVNMRGSYRCDPSPCHYTERRTPPPWMKTSMLCHIMRSLNSP